MQKFVLLLACAVGCATAGLLDSSILRDRIRLQDIGMNRNDVDRISLMSREDLLRQKFLLDILMHVQQPLLIEELLQLGSTLIVDEDRYTETIDDEMLNLIEKCRSHQLVSKDVKFSITDSEHMRQLIGLYRMLVRSRDWDTFQRIACFARLRMNGVLFVNALILAVRDREDTRMLILPGIHEILPELYFDENLVRKVHSNDINLLSTDTETMKPTWMDLMDRRMGINRLDMIDTDRIKVLTKSDLWMPWREMRIQMALRKDPVMSTSTRVDKIVLPVERSTNNQMALLTEDVGLKGFMQGLIADLMLKEKIVQNSMNADQLRTERLGRVGLERNVGSMLERERSQMDVDRNMEQTIGIDDGRRMSSENVMTNNDGLLRVGRRRMFKDVGDREEVNRELLGRPQISEGRRVVDDMRNERMMTMQKNRMLQRDDIPNNIGNGRLLVVGRRRAQMMANPRDRFMGIVQPDREMIDNDIMGRPHISEGRRVVADRGDERMMKKDRMRTAERSELDMKRGRMVQRDNIPTTSIDDENLLRIGRRRSQLLANSRSDEISGTDDQPIVGEEISMDMDAEDQIERRRMRDERVLGRWSRWWMGEGMNSETRRRAPRSVGMQMINDELRTIEKLRSGELLIHNLRQLLARINMERISLGLTDVQDDVSMRRMNNPRLLQAADDRYAMRLNDLRLDTRRNRIMLDSINELERRLDVVITDELRRISQRGSDISSLREGGNIDQVIGDVLLGKVEGTGVLEMIRELLLQSKSELGGNTLEDVGVILEDPVMQRLLRRIVRVINKHRDQLLGSYTRQDIAMSGVSINDVIVDRLRTFVDVSDADLINLRDPQVMLNGKLGMQKILVARQQRLNHKPFTISVDLNSDRNQRVVIRTMLGPKLDTMGQELRLDELRDNFLLLDATVADLRMGHNLIKRKSRDISWTARDTTPYTEIYQRVMMAIDGVQDAVVIQPVVGQSCRFPHRLLLPRGRIEGLPMQMLVVVTPVLQEDQLLQRTIRSEVVCGMETGSLNLDRLPLGFPLDRRIDDVDQMLSSTNLMLKDVIIYHDDKLKMDLL